MENTNCETCAGDGAVITYNTKDNRLEVQRCDECASFDTDQEAWEALKPWDQSIKNVAYGKH